MCYCLKDAQVFYVHILFLPYTHTHENKYCVLLCLICICYQKMKYSTQKKHSRNSLYLLQVTLLGKMTTKNN